jgi:toxin YoeB
VKIVWANKSWGQYTHWQHADQAISDKINDLIKDIRRDPFKGLGKPEPLKGALAGFWSRRITSIAWFIE